MSLHPALRATMQQTVYRAAYSGAPDNYGKRTLGTPAAILCRFEDARKAVRTASGDERMTAHALTTETDVADDDAIWTPGQDTSITKPRFPLSVSRCVDADGVFSHCVVYL